MWYSYARVGAFTEPYDKLNQKFRSTTHLGQHRDPVWVFFKTGSQALLGNEASTSLITLSRLLTIRNDWTRK